MASYGVFTGWYCDEQPRRYRTFGDDFVRSAACFPVWLDCVERSSSPREILVIDSNSPVPAPIPPNNSRIQTVQLEKNFGHAANLQGQLCGMARTVLLGLMYCLMNDYEYGVYLEQGCLVRGDRFIDNLIEANPEAEIIIPSGAGTPQPVQTSLIIVKKSFVMKFINLYLAYEESDKAKSPEKKIHEIALQADQPCIANLDYGRRRPLDLTKDAYFVKHLTTEELTQFMSLMEKA